MCLLYRSWCRLSSTCRLSAAASIFEAASSTTSSLVLPTPSFRLSSLSHVMKCSVGPLYSCVKIVSMWRQHVVRRHTISKLINFSVGVIDSYPLWETIYFYISECRTGNDICLHCKFLGASVLESLSVWYQKLHAWLDIIGRERKTCLLIWFKSDNVCT